MKRFLFILLIPSFVLAGGYFGSGGGGGGIASINSDTTSAQVIAAGTAGSDVAVSTSGGTTTINVPTASGTNRGALSSADWTTFNGKLSAVTFPLLGDAGSVSAPTYAFTGGSSNTGFYLPAADEIGAALNGVQRFRLDATQSYFGTYNGTDTFMNIYGTTRPYIEIVRGADTANWRVGINAMTSGITADSFIIGSHGFDNFEIGFASDASYTRYGFSRSGKHMASLGGPIIYNVTAVGNVGAGVDTLISVATGDSKPLGHDGDYYRFKMFGTTGANAHNKQIICYLNTTAIWDSGVVTWNNLSWELEGTIIRNAASTQLISGKVGVSDPTVYASRSVYVSGAENNELAQTFKCTGEDSDGTPTNDSISQKGLIVEWYPAALNN